MVEIRVTILPNTNAFHLLVHCWWRNLKKWEFRVFKWVWHANLITHYGCLQDTLFTQRVINRFVRGWSAENNNPLLLLHVLSCDDQPTISGKFTPLGHCCHGRGTCTTHCNISNWRTHFTAICVLPWEGSCLWNSLALLCSPKV